MRAEFIKSDDELPALQSAHAYPEKMILFILAAGHFISVVDFVIIIPFGPQLTETLNLSTQQFGWIVSSYTLAAGVTGLITAALIDRIGRKSAFLMFYTGFLVGTFLCGFAPNFATLLAARTITGAFGGVMAGVAMAIIGDVFPEERRGRATGVLISGFAVASVTGVPLGIYLGERFGWHVPFYSLAVIGLPILFFSIAYLPPLKGHLGKPPIHPIRFLTEMWQDSNQLYAFALTITLVFGAFAVIPFIPTFYVTNVGVPKKNLPLLYILGGAFTLVGAPLAGRLADRFGKLRTFRTIAPMSASVLLAITFLPDGATTLAVICFAGLMVANAGRMVAAMAMITGSVLPERRGGFMSANTAIQHMASGLGAVAAGAMITKDTAGRLQHYPNVGIMAAMVTLVGLWLAGKLRTVTPETPTTFQQSLAAAEADVDVSPPIAS